MENIQVIFGSLRDLLTLEKMGWLFLGAMVGMVFGAAPGLTATTGVALFTPMTFYLPLNASLCLLLGIYTTGFYAGSIPSILIRTPGSPGNAATALDGYPMAQAGKSGLALTHAVFGSYFGGTFSAFVLLIFAPILARFALQFGNPEYFALGMLGLAAVSGVSSESVTKGVIGGVVGMLLAVVGMDPIVGVRRMTFGSSYLLGGIQLIPALVGLFAISEVFRKVDFFKDDSGKVSVEGVKSVLPSRKLYWPFKWVLIKSAIIGVIVGVIPGPGPTIAAWISYNEAKRSAKNPEMFGKGADEGVLACETANSSCIGGALIPMLTLGIPGDTVTAVLLSALMIQGLAPGPSLLVNNYGLAASILWMLILANIFMLIIGLIGSRYFPYILKIRWQIILPVVVLLCFTGGYAANNSFFDVKVLVIIGFVAYFMQSFGFPIAPVVLGLILGPIVEPNFRRALMGNDWTIFFTRPLSLAVIILAVLIVVVMQRKMKTSDDK